jgi:class 3 adenylate cyclase
MSNQAVAAIGRWIERPAWWRPRGSGVAFAAAEAACAPPAMPITRVLKDVGCGLTLVIVNGGGAEIAWSKVAELLAAGNASGIGAGASSPHERGVLTLLFTDIVGATERAEQSGDECWCSLLERHHAVVRAELTRFHGRELDTAGDGFFAAFDGPTCAVRCAAAIRAALRGLGIEIRAGLHAGECEVVESKVAGVAVHVAARVAASAAAGEILVSSTVKDLVGGAGLTFVDAGWRALKGISDPWRLFSLGSDES